MELTGGCLCKAVGYRIAEAPVTARACWCRMCQVIGGGSGTVNALFNTAALTVNGHLIEFKFVADSGNVMYCRFCPICGTHVLVTSQRRPHFTAVRVGTLDDPNNVSPESTIWTSMHQRGRRSTPCSPACTDSLRQEDQRCLADIQKCRL
jgi:hypothetical protein